MALIEPLNSLIQSLQYRITAFWLKPTLLGVKQSARASAARIYVLEQPSRIDRVLLKYCIDQQKTHPDSFDLRSQLIVLHTDQGALGRRTQSGFAPRLLERASNIKPSAIELVPVAIFWGHQPDRELSIWKSALSEDWSGTSALRRLLNFVFNPHHLLIEFGQSILFDPTKDKDLSQELLARKTRRLVRQQFKTMRRSAIGPDLSHRRTLVKELLATAPVQSAIQAEASTRGQASTDRRARKIIDRLISDQSYRIVRFFNGLLTWLWQSLYGGIDVRNIELAKKATADHRIVYTPCHRSHMDYLLLSYVLYHNGLTPPHIAAGDNLNLPLVGPLLRRAGAFFMRRRFGDDNLYKAIFTSYLRLMLEKGHALEYFIEGGRSRTGRMRVPRRGMLGMTLRSAMQAPSLSIAFVPVHFGYDRVFEVNSYLSELEGITKQKESLLDLLRVFKRLKLNYGKVQVSFGEPVLFNPEDTVNSMTEAGQEPPIALIEEVGPSKQLVGEIAQSINCGVNACTSIGPMTLFATALTLTQRGAIDRERLKTQLDLLRSIMPQSQLTAVCARSPADTLAESALTQLSIKPDVGSGAPSVRVSRVQRAELSYHANDISHLLVTPSLTAQMLVTSHNISTAKLYHAAGLLDPLFSEELFFASGNERKACQRAVKAFEAAGIINSHCDYWQINPESSTGYSNLFDLSQLVRPYLVRYLLLAQHVHPDRFSTNEAVDRTRALGQDALINLVGHYPWFEKDYDEVVANKLYRRELERPGYARQIIDLTSALLPPEILAKISDAKRLSELKDVESSASPL